MTEGGDLEGAVLTAQVSQCLVVRHSRKAFFEFVGVNYSTVSGLRRDVGAGLQWGIASGGAVYRGGPFGLSLDRKARTAVELWGSPPIIPARWVIVPLSQEDS